MRYDENQKGFDAAGCGKQIGAGINAIIFIAAICFAVWLGTKAFELHVFIGVVYTLWTINYFGKVIGRISRGY